MLDELFATIYDEDNHHDDNNPAFRSLRISRVERQDETLVFWLDVLYYDEDDIVDDNDISNNTDSVQRWQVSCSSVREHRFSLGYYYDISLLDDHVLLMPHVTRRAVLSFHGRAEDVSSVIGALYERHKEVVGAWIPFGEYLNSMPLTKLLAGGFGMLAEGPKTLLAAYKEVLERHGVQASHYDSEPFASSYNEKWIEETTRLKVLILEKSYVVAADFLAKRV